MRRFALLAVVLLGFTHAAQALTVRDIIELSRAGLGEEVLLALIEVDGSVYGIDSNTLKTLKDAGVPERVIVAMIRSGRQPRPQDQLLPPVPVEEARAPEPQVVVIDHREEPRVREVMVPVPIYVPVETVRVRRHRGAAFVHSPLVESTYSTFVPFQSGPLLVDPEIPKTDRVYWGFGGKLRPDAWKPDGHKSDGQRSDRDRSDRERSDRERSDDRKQDEHKPSGKR